MNYDGKVVNQRNQLWKRACSTGRCTISRKTLPGGQDKRMRRGRVGDTGIAGKEVVRWRHGKTGVKPKCWRRRNVEKGE